MKYFVEEKQLVIDAMFPNDEAIFSFMEMSKKHRDKERPDDTYNRERKKKIEETLPNALLLVEKDPGHTGHKNILGCVYLELKQYKEAINCFLKAIEIDPTYKAFWNNLSIAYYQIGEKMKALDCFKEGLLLEKDHGSIITEGPDYVLQGKTLDEYLKEIDQYSEENIPAITLHFLFLLTTYYLKSNNYTLAIKCLIRLIRHDSRNTEFYYHLSSCLWKTGEEERAIKFLKKALTINPDDCIVLDTLVTLYFQRSNYLEAKNCLQQLHKIKQNDTEIILDLACTHSKLQEKEETIFFLNKCLDIDFSHYHAIINDEAFIPYLIYLNNDTFRFVDKQV